MKKILVAEDDKFLLSAYRVKLAKAGFEVQTAMDGEEVLEALKNYTPDLILLDLVMPKKDGFATLAQLKAHDKFRDIPVIVSSNLGQKEDMDRALTLGANGYFVKSDLDLSDLIVKIRSLLEEKT